MSVTVTELWESRRSQRTRADKTAVRVFRVVFDSVAAANPVAAETATGVPALSSVHPSDASRTVASIVPDQDARDARVFLVTVDYDDALDQQDNPSGGETATGLPTVQIGSVPRTRALQLDVAGNPIVNSAGDPFDPPPEIDETDTTITVRATVEFNGALPQTLEQYRDTTNNGILFGYAAGSLRLVELAMQTRTDAEGDVVWDVAFQWHKGEWILELVDNGMYAGGSTTDQSQDSDLGTITVAAINVEARRRIRDDDGVPVNQPVLLNGAGGVLENGAPVTRKFSVRDATDHSLMLTNLFLPTTFAGFANQ